MGSSTVRWILSRTGLLVGLSFPKHASLAKVNADEQDIINYLKQWPFQFLSSRDICRRAGGKWRYRDDPYWATQPLLRLVEKRMVETDASGHFRLLDKPRQKRSQKWMSPELKKILEEGSKAGEGIEVDKPEEGPQ